MAESKLQGKQRGQPRQIYEFIGQFWVFFYLKIESQCIDFGQLTKIFSCGLKNTMPKKGCGHINGMKLPKPSSFFWESSVLSHGPRTPRTPDTQTAMLQMMQQQLQQQQQPLGSMVFSWMFARNEGPKVLGYRKDYLQAGKDLSLLSARYTNLDRFG